MDLTKDHTAAGAGPRKKRRRRRAADEGRKLEAFLANITHELRTPLNSVLILAKLLVENREHNLTEKQVEYARTIYASSNDLLLLVNASLDLARLDAGKMPVEPREVPLAEACAYAERSFRHVAELKQLDFRVELAPELAEARLHTDPLRLQQVLRNFLDNAFKFTEQGGVVLRVRPAPAPLAGGTRALAVSVTDTGIGIARDQHAVIFEPFEQADDAAARGHGGVGLGLAICREIARLLGGEIAVESALGVGSTFTLVLPERYGAGAAPDAEGEAGAQASGAASGAA